MERMSSLERVIYNILLNEKIPFEREKQFKDCYHGYYRFDYWLPRQNVIIEVNGIQHYEYTKIFHKKKSDFTKAKERDRRKISYCLAHNIPIYIIPYWEIENLKTFKDITSSKFSVTSKFHNDLTWREHQKIKEAKL